MGFSILSRLWPLVPKRLLIELVVAFCVYMVGISHGREPYKQAAAKQEIKAKILTETFTQTETNIREKGKKTNEALKDYECVIGTGVADWLQHIGNN